MPPRKRAPEPPADDEIETEELFEADEQDGSGDADEDEGGDDEQAETDEASDEADEDTEAEETETGDDEEGDGETVVSFADEEQDGDEGEGENTVIRRIRERNKELARENAELRQRAEAAAPTVEIDIGPKPTFADANFDEEAYEQKLDEWKERKARADRAKAEQDEIAEAAKRDWQRDLETYDAKKAALGKRDFDERIEPLRASLSLPQQAVIVKAAQDPAAFSYALAGSDARLAELAKIADPIKLAAAVARMEGGVTVTKRRKAPPPDRPARGSAKLPGTDKQLEKLEAEAERTGDRTAVINYKKKLEARGKKKAHA